MTIPDPAEHLKQMHRDMLNSVEAGRSLLSAIDDRRPTSVIRVGDGEGVVAAMPRLDHPVTGPYLESHFGRQVTQNAMDDLGRRLRESIESASILGIRPDVLSGSVPQAWFALEPDAFLRAFRADFVLRPAELDSLRYGDAYRLALLNTVMAGLQLSAETRLVSAWCHFDWLDSGLLADIVRRERHIGLISSHADLVAPLAGAGIDVDHYAVPVRFRRAGRDWTPHYPDRFDELLRELRVHFRGQVFLVGAGICGKIYCDEIARRGGIAIDVGAVCDAWLGIASRPLVLLSRYGSEAVPRALRLDRQLHAGGEAPGADDTP